MDKLQHLVSGRLDRYKREREEKEERKKRKKRVKKEEKGVDKGKQSEYIEQAVAKERSGDTEKIIVINAQTLKIPVFREGDREKNQRRSS